MVVRAEKRSKSSDSRSFGERLDTIRIKSLVVEPYCTEVQKEGSNVPVKTVLNLWRKGQFRVHQAVSIGVEDLGRGDIEERRRSDLARRC